VQDKGGWRGAFCMPHHTDAGVLAFRWGGELACEQLHSAVPTLQDMPSLCVQSVVH
jgi:hypothetical protein